MRWPDTRASHENFSHFDSPCEGSLYVKCTLVREEISGLNRNPGGPFSRAMQKKKRKATGNAIRTLGFHRLSLCQDLEERFGMPRHATPQSRIPPGCIQTLFSFFLKGCAIRGNVWNPPICFRHYGCCQRRILILPAPTVPNLDIHTLLSSIVPLAIAHEINTTNLETRATYGICRAVPLPHTRQAPLISQPDIDIVIEH